MLTNFFGWCVKQKYASENPVKAVDAPFIEQREPAVLSLLEVRKLLMAALEHEGGILLPSLSLALFAGLRPAEISRLP